MHEMLRIKRSIQATYNTQVNMMAAQMMTTTCGSADSVSNAKDAMRLLEAKAAEMAVKSGGSENSANVCSR